MEQISEKTSYFNLVKVLFYFCHIPRVSLNLKKKNTQAILVICSFKPTQLQPSHFIKG